MSPDTPPKPSAAPERRRGPLGQSQVRVRDEWLDEDAPGTMAAWAEYQADLRHQAVQARLAPPAAPQVSSRAPTEPTARQREVWEAVEEHGTQTAAARALGTSQGSIQSALKGYMKAMGIDGPLPGRQHGKPKAERPGPDQQPVEPVAPPTRAASSVPVAPRSESGKAEQGRREGPGNLGSHATDPAEPPRAAQGEPEAPAEAIESSEPVAPASVPEPGPDVVATPQSSDQQMDGSVLAPLVGLELRVSDDHREGYARGYAVAVLRIVSGWESNELPEYLQDMANDAADGLMS